MNEKLRVECMLCLMKCMILMWKMFKGENFQSKNRQFDNFGAIIKSHFGTLVSGL